MSKLTEEQVDEYVKDGGATCPFPGCGGRDFHGEAVEIDQGDFPGEVTQKVTCAKCGRRWLNIYRLDGFNVFAEEPDPAEDEAQAEVKREQRLAEEVLAAEHMGEKRVIGKLVCSECGSDNVMAHIEERTRYYPPQKAAWPADEDGDVDQRLAVEVAEEEGSKKDTDTTDTGWYCRECGCETVKVVPVAEPAPTVQA